MKRQLLLTIMAVATGITAGFAFAVNFSNHPPDASNELSQVQAVVRNIVDDNQDFVNTHKPEYFTPLIKGQSPRATVVTCSDSRIHSHDFDKTPDGDLFVVRNIGNQVFNSEGSIEYGIHHLHTPLLMIIGHSTCGAVKAAMADYRELEPAIKRELATLEVSNKNSENTEQVKKSVEENVNHQISYAMREFAPEIKNGQLTVIGTVFDFRNDYQQGYGKLVITNLNGDTNQDRIKHSPVFEAAQNLNK